MNASDITSGQEIGVENCKITCIDTNLLCGTSTIVLDAEGGYITPGGVDSHVHLEQANTPMGDTWETGTRSAVCGGTTTVIAFVLQACDHESLLPLLEKYSMRAAGNSHCDYGFHLILTDPTSKILQEEIPLLAREQGITSIRLYMTYDPMKLADRDVLSILIAHAENHDMIDLCDSLS